MWKPKKCGCIKADLPWSGEKAVIRCEKHREKTFKKRVHLHIDADGIVRRG